MYNELLTKWKQALLDRKTDEYFIHSNETRQKMYIQYKALGSIEKFTNWLEKKAAEESAGMKPGSTTFAIMGGS